MLVSNQENCLANKTSKASDSVLLLLQKLLEDSSMNLKDIAQNMGVSPFLLEDILSKKSELSLNVFISFLDWLELDEKQFLKGEYDFQILLKRMNGNSEAISDFYLCAPNSKLRTLQHIFQASQTLFGELEAKLLFKKLQIPSHFLTLSTHADFNVSIRLISHALKLVHEKMNRMNMEPTFLFQSMGRNHASYHEKTALGKFLREALSVQPGNSVQYTKLYEAMFEGVLLFVEKNWKYEIQKSNSEQFVFHSYQSEELIESYKVKNYSNEETCLFRGGFASALPRLVGLKNARFHHSKCVHRGHTYCSFELSYSS